MIKAIPVRHSERHNSSIVVIAPDYYWGERSAEQRATQLSLKREYDHISELLALFLDGTQKELAQQLQDVDKQFRVWLELDGWNWSISPYPSENEHKLRSAAGEIEKILGVLDNTGDQGTILVPDTNSLLAMVDPTQYRTVAAHNSFVFMLLPTVLGELDRLKVEHRNPDVREKAKKAITRIKGWRQQGSLTSGVTVDRSITVKASHMEPDMNRTLSWLDRDTPDDRIVASVLALQTEHPSAHIVLITGDINLQNKADAAFVETAEAPQPSD